MPFLYCCFHVVLLRGGAVRAKLDLGISYLNAWDLYWGKGKVKEKSGGLNLLG